MTFSKDDDEHYTIEWCLLSYPWSKDNEIEDYLAKNIPFW